MCVRSPTGASWCEDDRDSRCWEGDAPTCYAPDHPLSIERCQPRGCTADTDCTDAEWCRPTETGDSARCVPYLTEGERCGGFVPPWAQNRCDPRLTCTDFDEQIPDLPGYCRLACDASSACPDGQLCDSGGICRDSMPCESDTDRDGVCDHLDRICNLDDVPLNCRMLAPECLPGAVPELRNGCYTGICVAWTACGDQGTTGCVEDVDCGPTEWCRPTSEGGFSCTPYQNEGEACGGFVAPPFQTRCDPQMICTDHPPLLADAPGVCRVPCDENLDCPADQYCSSNGTCRDDGTCFEPVDDCDAAGNSYTHISCAGYSRCSGGLCAWDCGFPQCRDLAEIFGSGFYGFCDQVLGWGVLNGQCAPISACADPNLPLFADQASCQLACAR